MFGFFSSVFKQEKVPLPSPGEVMRLTEEGNHAGLETALKKIPIPLFKMKPEKKENVVADWNYRENPHLFSEEERAMYGSFIPVEKEENNIAERYQFRYRNPRLPEELELALVWALMKAMEKHRDQPSVAWQKTAYILLKYCICKFPTIFSQYIEKCPLLKTHSYGSIPSADLSPLRNVWKSIFFVNRLDFTPFDSEFINDPLFIRAYNDLIVYLAAKGFAPDIHFNGDPETACNAFKFYLRRLYPDISFAHFPKQLLQGFISALETGKALAPQYEIQIMLSAYLNPDVSRLVLDYLQPTQDHSSASCAPK